MALKSQITNVFFPAALVPLDPEHREQEPEPGERDEEDLRLESCSVRTPRQSAQERGNWRTEQGSAQSFTLACCPQTQLAQCY